MEKLFKLKAHGTDVKTEIRAGITTFFAMAYIIFVNSNYLSMTGMNKTGVMVATCISAAIGCLLTAFLANVPFCQAPGMGLNTFFTFTVCFGMGYTWEQALAIVFISGVLFLVVTVSPLRKKIIEAIPASLKAAISAGIGFFIALIGMFNVNIVTAFGTGIAGAYTDMGSITKGAALLALIGLAITAILVAYRVKGAIFIGIIATTLIGFLMGQTTIPESFTVAGIGEAFGEVAFKLDFSGALSAGGVVPFLTAIITFAICDCFDTVGTLLGTAGNAGMLDENGNFPGGDRALIADAIATCTGALLGTSTVTTFVESSTGIEDGGRTGLTSMTTGILFLLAVILAPVAGHRSRPYHRRRIHDEGRAEDRLVRYGDRHSLLPHHRHDALCLLHCRWYRLWHHFLHPHQAGPRQGEGSSCIDVHSLRSVHPQLCAAGDHRCLIA